MRRLLLAVVVVLVLLGIADVVGERVVENRVAARIDDTLAVSGTTVDVAGWPFLTQVLRNDFSRIDVSLPTISRSVGLGSLRVERIRARLHDVSTSDRYSTVTARAADGSGVIPYEQLDRIESLSVGYGGASADGRGYLELSAPAFGGAGIKVVPDIADGLTLSFEDPARSSGALPRLLARFLSQRLQVSGLPAGLTVTGVSATPEGLRVELTGDGFVFGRR